MKIAIKALWRLSPLRALRSFLSRNNTKGERLLCLESHIAANRKSLSAITFLILCLVSITLADDFTTVEGEEYKNMTVKRVDPDGINLTSKSGIVKLYFAELPAEVQQRFHYDAAAAQTYSDEQYVKLEQLAKQQAEWKRQAEEATNKANQYHEQELREIDQAKAARQAAQSAQERRQNLQARYHELQTEEDALLLQIGEGQLIQPHGRFNYEHTHPNIAQLLPFLQGRLNDVRQAKEQIRRELEQL